MIENRILTGDCFETLKTLPDKSVNACVTSPPYYMLRDYGGVDKQIGLEQTPQAYIENLLAVFGEVYRVLKDDGTLWVNIADSYGRGCRGSANSNKPSPKHRWHSNEFPAYGNPSVSKSLTGIPFRFALAMIDAGWLLRQDIIWSKPSCMPESVKDRFCKSHEYIFFFVKQLDYYFNHKNALERAVSVQDKGRPYRNSDYSVNAQGQKAGYERDRIAQREYVKIGNSALFEEEGADVEITALRTMRDVWRVNPEPSREKHYAMFPQKLIKPCIECGCPEGGIVLDPFMGSGTTALVAKKLGRRYIGCEINAEYVRIAERRIAEINPLFDREEERQSVVSKD